MVIIYMTVCIELTKDDINKLSTEKEININTKLVYKENKIEDLNLFMKIVKNERMSS